MNYLSFCLPRNILISPFFWRTVLLDKEFLIDSLFLLALWIFHFICNFIEDLLYVMSSFFFSAFKMFTCLLTVFLWHIKIWNPLSLFWAFIEILGCAGYFFKVNLVAISSNILSAHFPLLSFWDFSYACVVSPDGVPQIWDSVHFLHSF